jgi:hypothetical protein
MRVALVLTLMGLRASAQLTPPALQRIDGSCSDINVLIDRSRALDGACDSTSARGEPSTCSPQCGAALLPFLDDCGPVVNQLLVRQIPVD